MTRTDTTALLAAAAVRGGNRSPLLYVLAIVLGLQCIVSARASISYQLADGNSAELVAIARGCVETDQCLSRGGAGRLGLFSGTLWTRLIAHVLRTGGDLTRVQSIVVGMLLLSTAITFAVLLQSLGLRAATLAIGLYLPLVLAATELKSLDNPNAYPLPAALYYAGVVLFVQFRRPAFVVLASCALAAAVSAYVLFLLVLPFHLLVVGLWARRPVLAVTLAGILFLVALCLDSLDAVHALVGRVLSIQATAGLPVVGLGALLVLVVRTIRRAEVLTSLSPPVRVRVVMVAALVYSTVAVWLASGLAGMPLPPESRYFAPALFPVVFLAAESTGALGTRALVVFASIEVLALFLLAFAPSVPLVGRTPLVCIVTLLGLGIGALTILQRGAGRAASHPMVAGVLVCFALGVTLPDIVVPSPAEKLGFHLAEGEPIVSSLYAAGYTYPQIFGALHGPAADTVLPLLAAHDPHLFEKPGYVRVEDFSLLLLKVPHAALPRTRGVIVASRIDRSRTGIVVRGERPFLDWLRAEICRPPRGETSVPSDCIILLLQAPLFRIGPYLAVVNTASPGTENRPHGEENFITRPPWQWPESPNGGPQRGEEPGPLRVTMPVHTPGRGAPHIVHVGEALPDETWRIKRVTGVDYEGTLPAVEIRLLDRHESAGFIELEVAGVGNAPPWEWLRHFIEVTEDNAHLVQP